MFLLTRNEASSEKESFVTDTALTHIKLNDMVVCNSSPLQKTLHIVTVLCIRTHFKSFTSIFPLKNRLCGRSVYLHPCTSAAYCIPECNLRIWNDEDLLENCSINNRLGYGKRFTE